MYKLRLPAIALILLSFCAWTGKVQAADKPSVPIVQNSIPVQVKVVINENGKEIKSYLYDFQAGNGQEALYKNAITTPYVESKSQETRWFDLKSEIAVTPSTTDANTVVNSKVSMTVNLASGDSTLPLLTSFEYAGVSVHPKAEFVKVFSGVLKDLTYTVDVYVKAGN